MTHKVEKNGLVNSWLVSFGGQIVMTGLTREASQAYADRLNKESQDMGVEYEAVVLPDKNRSTREVCPFCEGKGCFICRDDFPPKG